ncbi:hypothetical protein, partial [Methylocapsa aurea]|uniref:hypothetical protein n=1 Tax=Methylocapsa aurea TaxID=663610 RepID=UPI000561BD43
KSNIGPDDGGFNYELQAVPMREHPDIIASVVSWGEAVTGAARDILAEAEARPEDDTGEGSAFREAKDWLFDFLVDGPRSAKEVKVGGRDACHSWRTIERAKQSLEIISKKSGEGGWVWTLPQGFEPSPPTPSNPGVVGGLGGLQEKQQVSERQDRQENQHRQDRQGFRVDGVVGGLAETGEHDFGLDEAATGSWEGEI